MRPKRVIRMVEALLISAILVVGGCNQPAHRTSGTVYPPPEPVRICYRDSETFNLTFAFPCEDQEMARIAAVVCDFMGASARSLIAYNRQIGPTTPERLIGAALPDIRESARVMYEVMGRDAAEAYLREIVSMGYNIAQRNITDLITYPEQKCRNCLREFKYVVN